MPRNSERRALLALAQAMPHSQVRTLASPRQEARPEQAARKVSCARSSASSWFAATRRRKARTACWGRSIRVERAALDPARAATTSAASVSILVERGEATHLERNQAVHHSRGRQCGHHEG